MSAEHSYSPKFKGYWDRIVNGEEPTGGPIIECIECEEESYFTWDEFKEIAKQMDIAGPERIQTEIQRIRSGEKE